MLIYEAPPRAKVFVAPPARPASRAILLSLCCRRPADNFNLANIHRH
jgi:hypothetical protein